MTPNIAFESNSSSSDSDEDIYSSVMELNSDGMLAERDDQHSLAHSTHLVMVEEVQMGLEELEAEQQQLEKMGLQAENKLRQNGLGTS